MCLVVFNLLFMNMVYHNWKYSFEKNLCCILAYLVYCYTYDTDPSNSIIGFLANQGVKQNMIGVNIYQFQYVMKGNAWVGVNISTVNCSNCL